MNKLIFIVGFGRSGTTLIQSMLNAHSEITSPPESHFIKNYLVSSKKGKLAKFKDQDSLLAHLKNDPDIARLDIDLDHAVTGIDPSEPNYTRKLFLNLMGAYQDKKGKKHLAEKDPLNIGYLAAIKDAYPQAYLLHIIRDPRDVIASRIRTGWGKGYPFAIHTIEYDHYVKIAIEKGRMLFEERFFEFKYEDLIDDPEKQLKRICAMLEIEYERTMLEFHLKSEELVTKDEMQWKENIFKPVIKTNKEKWKNELSASQVQMIEAGTGELMALLGYAFTQKISVIRILIIRMNLGIWRFIYMIRSKMK